MFDCITQGVNRSTGMLEWKGSVRRKQRDLVMSVLCFWVIASHISTCNANMPAGQMRFLALSLQGCQGETQGTQQQHKWNQPTLPPPPPSNPIPNLDLCLGFQLWSECVRVCVFVQTALKIRHALFSYVCHWEWICGYFAPFLAPLALSVVAFMRNCFFASQRGQFIVRDSLLGVL